MNAQKGLFSSHCGGKRHAGMLRMLSFMLDNESRNEATTPREYAEAISAPRVGYRMFYAAEREGLVRQILVPKGARKDKAYVLREKGRKWIRDQEAFMAEKPAEEKVRKGKGGNPPCNGMVPLKQIDRRIRAIRKKRLVEALARLEERKRSGKGRK